MTGNTTFVLAVAAKCAVAIAAIAGAVYLAGQGRNGWGWLLLVAVLAMPGSIRTNDDKPTTEVAK